MKIKVNTPALLGNARPPVVAVIVAYNDLAALCKCLASIKASTYRPTRTVIVDNSITNLIESELILDPDIEYFRTGSNLGFTRGCNLGIARSLEIGATFTWLLNPDTEVDAVCLEGLTHCGLIRLNAGIVAGRICYAAAPQKLWYAGGDLNFLTASGKHRKCEVENGGTPIQEVSYATGCCMLIANTVFQKIGFLNESIFMYLDDVEFCMRVRAAKFKIYYNSNARLSHSVGPGMDFHQYPDYYLYFSIRNKPLVAKSVPYRLYLHGVALVFGGVKLIIYALRRRDRNRGIKVKAILLGTWDSLFKGAREESRFPQLFRLRT